MPNGAQAGELTYLPSWGQGLAGSFPALVNQDSNGIATTPSELWIKNSSGLYVPVSSSDPLPTALAGSNAIKIQGKDGTEPAAYTYGLYDHNADTDAQLATADFLLAYNETSWDRVRNNTQGTLLANAARTATVTSPTITNYNGVGLYVRMDISAIPAAPGTFGFYIEDEDNQILAIATGITWALGRYGIMLHPSLAGAQSFTWPNHQYNAFVQGLVPRQFTVTIVPSDSQSYTYEIDYEVLLG